MLWLLSLSDGASDLIAVAERSDLDVEVVARAAALLVGHGLLAEAPAVRRERR